ncbi:MAG: radical SAM family heme chaperone HemW [Thermodesulfovibrio sp.]|uniref:radical SAM family heme chaperone HemW n=2 Tax=unclassified Thermodesulfovibrio TaxID=2645936 RepID=UPI00248307B0|nr:radical SAM family heme chaperone HemW [Thermodesulfovibrio sp. 1176]MDI1472406.1 radical SAM family heme chaperone HemW [Thermodesulfovibrio sp. 1176]MDI6714271.1 radical SAM family heme chaperone HemW [Thermodesulfovibrio sp.]
MESFFSSLYVHIPFCIKKCKYCSFYSVPYEKFLELLYVDALVKEIELTKKIAHHIKTIYIGGGTPSCLSIKALEKILSALIENYKIQENVEFSIEVNPSTVSIEKLNLFRDFGVNRISIGIQSFFDNELKILGRLHNYKDALKVLKTVINSGFENVSVDLIYGIPYQTITSFINSIKIATSFSIKHISLYELSIEKGTPLEKDLKKSKINLSIEDEIERMYLTASEYLEKIGFQKYEISNFAYKGFECKHNLAYWMRIPYLGLGPSAHSFIGNKRFHNPSNIFSYAKIKEKNRTEWIDDYIVTPSEEIKEKIFLGMRMRKGVTVKSPCLIKFFRRFNSEGLINLKDNKVSLTDKGMLLSNEIFVQVISHIENCPVCKQV